MSFNVIPGAIKTLNGRKIFNLILSRKPDAQGIFFLLLAVVVVVVVVVVYLGPQWRQK